MFTAFTVIDGSLVEVDSFDTIDNAIIEMIRCGWEEDDAILLAQPILIYDRTGGLNVLRATVSYSVDIWRSSRPLLHVLSHFHAGSSLDSSHFHAGASLDSYRYKAKGDSYTAEQIY